LNLIGKKNYVLFLLEYCCIGPYGRVMIAVIRSNTHNESGSNVFVTLFFCACDYVYQREIKQIADAHLYFSWRNEEIRR